MITEIPTKDDADHAVAVEMDDALDRFISRWEPAGAIQQREWRKDLLAMLTEATAPLSRTP
jgi:hypothetical protein